MSMKIDDKRNWVCFVERVQKFLERVYLAMEISSRMSPDPIEIIS